MYVARVRNGFVPAFRRRVFEKIRHLASPKMPFANLPDTHKSRWGDELIAAQAWASDDQAVLGFVESEVDLSN